MQSVYSQLPESLKIWEKVRIIVGSGAAAGEYEARVEDFINGGIVITKPEFVRGKTLLRDGVPILVQFNREDAAYQFSTHIKRRSFRGSTQMLLTPPRGFRRVQRRLFVRIQTSTRVSYALITAVRNDQSWESYLNWQHTRCEDISGGGVLMRVTDQVQPQMLLLMCLEFFEDRDLPNKVAGICRRVSLDETGRLAGVEFLLADRLAEFFDKKTLNHLPQSVKEFDAMAQNKLVASIFYEQVALRQKGLL